MVVNNVEFFMSTSLQNFGKATTRHKMFPNDEATLKVVYLAIGVALKKMTSGG